MLRPSLNEAMCGQTTDTSFIVLATHKRSALNRVRIDLALLAFLFLLGIVPLAWWGVAAGQWFEPYGDDSA